MMTMLSNDRSVFAFLTVTAVPQVHLSHPSDLVDFLLSFRIFSPSPSLGNSATAIQHHTINSSTHTGTSFQQKHPSLLLKLGN